MTSELARLVELAERLPLLQRGRFIDDRRYNGMGQAWKDERAREEAYTVRGPGEVGTPGCNVVARVIGDQNQDVIDFLIAARAAVPGLVAEVGRLAALRAGR